MIDIHCHIVPNIDDGAKSLDDALEMAKIAYDEGIRKIVNTSHYHPNFEYLANAERKRVERETLVALIGVIVPPEGEEEN